ncbi:hypothetical protein HDU93_003235 [Gonapodya sp. JEL0774]|nr:hypothetical protein HDU93_003235 [Gonapodya sp. JEL0774]
MTVESEIPKLSSLPKKIAVIGAGPAGLIAARELLHHGNFEDVTVFEGRSDLGGIWNVTPDHSGDVTFSGDSEIAPLKSNASATSSAYPQLRTNTPFNTIEIRDFPIPENSDIFPGADVVKGYLKHYAQAKGVYKRIRFNRVVEQVLWNVETQDWTLRSNGEEGVALSRHDGIVVANGHYSQPYIPPIEGASRFKGRLLHSRDFRFESEFAGKSILVIGSGSSALDLSRILAGSAKTIHISMRESRFWDAENVADLVQKKNYPLTKVVPVKKFIGESAVELEDGTIIKDIDVVIFATGYLYDFPFLRGTTLSEHGAHLPDPDLEYWDLIGRGKGEVVLNLWKKAFYAWNPTLAFVGLPLYINSFPFFEFQGALIAKVWSGFPLQWPETIEDVIHAEEEEAKIAGAVDRFEGKSMVWSGKPQFEYQDALTETLGIWKTQKERLKVYEDPIALWALRNRLVFGAL